MRRAQPWKTNRSRSLRSKASRAEDLLWSRLRNRQLAGLKFVRQLPIGPFFADLACREHRIVIEVDGATHGSDEERRSDDTRAARLRAEGFRIFRVHNKEVYENVDGVVTTLLVFIRNGGV